MLGIILNRNQGQMNWLDIWSVINQRQLKRGHREGGPTARSKKFKTPFFEIYSKILLRGYSNGSRTSPFFFFLKYINKYGCYKQLKFWPK